MNSVRKMTIIFQDIIQDVNIVHIVKGIITDITDSSICVMLENNNFMVFTTESLLEISEYEI
ncbi:hypothetical protein AYK20_02655 [Thermoplasmatales archaeon SG8-52-1]|nr:MAG: hypothetical protein AYK20_02655 [Thermoplasmatales archaeon SG8-52-1]